MTTGMRILPLMASPTRDNELTRVRDGYYSVDTTEGADTSDAFWRYGRTLTARHGLSVVSWESKLGGVKVRLVLTDDGKAALDASEKGFVWCLTHNRIDRAATREFWLGAISTARPYARDSFDLIHRFVANLPDPTFTDVVEAFWRNEIERLPHLWEDERQRLFAIMKNPPPGLAHLAAEATLAMLKH